MAKKPIEIPPGRLWPNTPSGAPLNIEVFGATGDYKAGKTLLGMQIAPGSHPEGHPFEGQPRTLYLDFEKSGGTYGGTGCRRIDVPVKMQELKGSNYRPIDVFTWFLDVVTTKLKPGQFDVIIADPITDIESGLVDYVKANCEQFGLTKDQVTKAAGLLWGAVKDYWKQVLLKMSTRCQTFYFTSHLRQAYEGNTPIRGKREPKGKDTLMELSSLYLWLEREPDKEGKVPAVPSAIVLKERLADTLMTADGQLQIIQLLPPRLPVATVAAIREYVANPPNYDKLKPAERVVEKEMTEAEKLSLQLQISENERETEANRVQRLVRQEELKRLAMQEATSKPQNSDKTAEMQKAKANAKRAADQQAEIDRLNKEATEKQAEMTAEGLRLMEDNDGANVAQKAATAEQVALAKQLCQRVLEVRKDLTKESFSRVLKEKVLGRVGAKRIEDLTRAHCDHLIETLRTTIAKATGEPPEGDGEPEGN
jgi:hypothetical protein